MQTSVENRLLHSIVTKIFAPRAGSFNVVTDHDVCIMYHIINETPHDFSDFMMSIMKEALRRTKAALPYGMFLRYVFEHFHVKLKGEIVVELRHSDIFNAHSLHRMDAKRDGIWTKVRTRAGENPASQPLNQPPQDQPQQFYSSPLMDFNFDFSEPPSFMNASHEPHPFMSSVPESHPFMFAAPEPPPCDTNPPPRPTIEICEEQI